MGKKRLLLLPVLLLLLLVITGGSGVFASTARIDCFPEAESKFSGYSKDACLARNCLFDDSANNGLIQCYLRPNYGYQLNGVPQTTSNGMQFRLKRNQAVGSMFPEPIENVLLDVQYYSNDILRFKLTDADRERYEVNESLPSLAKTPFVV